MTIETLIKISPSPASPNETPGDWVEVERKIGKELPSDYKSLIAKYGSGSFGGFLYLLNPFSKLEGYDYFQHVQEILNAYKKLKKTKNLAHDVYPSPEGLYPFAVTDNGDVLYWKIFSDPKEWTIILYNSRHWKYEEYFDGAVGFLLKWLSGNLGSEIFETPANPSFNSY